MGSESYPFNHFSHEALTRPQAAAYLARLHLPPTLLNSKASYELLDEIFLAQLERVPKDSSPLHVPQKDWEGDPAKDIVLGSSFAGMPVGSKAFERIVTRRKGGESFGWLRSRVWRRAGSAELGRL